MKFIIKWLLWIIWMFFNMSLIIFVFTGQYRKISVMTYIAVEDLYGGSTKLSTIVMFAECCFLYIVSLYLIYLFTLWRKRYKKKVNYYSVCCWGTVFIYMLYYVMFMQLYH